MKDVKGYDRTRPAGSPRHAMRPPRDYPWQDLWDDRPRAMEGDVEMADEDFAADVQRANAGRSRAADSPSAGTDEQFTGPDDYGPKRRSADDDCDARGGPAAAGGDDTGNTDTDYRGTLSDARLAYLAETGQLSPMEAEVLLAADESLVSGVNDF